MSSKKVNQKSLQERVVFEVSVAYVTGHDKVRIGRSADLSAGGVYLSTMHYLPVGDILKISLSQPDQKQGVFLSCNTRIAWTNYEGCRRKPDYLPGAGLQFLDLPRKDIARLEILIDQYDDVKKMNIVCAWCGLSMGLRKGPMGRTSHGLCQCCREGIHKVSSGANDQ